MTDEERLNWLEDKVSEGFCPAILNDDNGHWAVAFDGVQDCSFEDTAQDTWTSFFVEAKYWKNSIREAIDFVMNEMEEGKYVE